MNEAKLQKPSVTIFGSQRNPIFALRNSASAEDLMKTVISAEILTRPLQRLILGAGTHHVEFWLVQDAIQERLNIVEKLLSSPSADVKFFLSQRDFAAFAACSGARKEEMVEAVNFLRDKNTIDVSPF